MHMFIKKFRFSGLLVSTVGLFFLVNSCEVGNDLIGNALVQKIEGTWSCIEDVARKKSTLETYEVEIASDPENASGILVYNIYGLGEEIYAKADVGDMTITINDNVPGGFQISGTGIIDNNYKVINWSFSVNDGSGVSENFTAVYSKVD
jgi:hypothetical protein